MAAIRRWNLLSDQEKADYTGVQLKPLYCSKHAWNATGLLQSAWNESIKPQIDCIIEKNFKLVHGRKGVPAALSWSLYLLSSTDNAAAAQPTILVLSSNRKAASKARKLILDHSLFKNLDTGFEIECEIKSFSMQAGDVEPQSLHRWSPRDVDQSFSTLCGAPVVVTAYPTSQDSKWRSGTILSVVHSGTQAFAVLPAHLFYPETIGNTADDDDQSDTCSISPTSDQDGDQTSADSGYFGSDFSSQITPVIGVSDSMQDPPSKHSVYVNRGRVSAKVDVSSLTLLGHFDPENQASSGNKVSTFSRVLDYALVAIEYQAFDLPNQTVGLSGEVILIDNCCTEVQDGKALILSASQGIKEVQVSGTAVTMMFPWSSRPQNVWQLEYSLPAGDSGSMVIYPNGMMVGMAFATVPELDITYVMPALDMFQSINANLDSLKDSMMLPSIKTLIPTQTTQSVSSSPSPLSEIKLEPKTGCATDVVRSNISDQDTENDQTGETKGNASTTPPSFSQLDKVNDVASVQASSKRLSRRPSSRRSAAPKEFGARSNRFPEGENRSEGESASGSATRNTEESSSVTASSATSAASLRAGEVHNGRLSQLKFPADGHNLVLYDIHRQGKTWEHAELFYSLLSQSELSAKASHSSKNGPVKEQMAGMNIRRRSVIEKLIIVLANWEPIWLESVRSTLPSTKAPVDHFQIILRRKESDRSAPPARGSASPQINSSLAAGSRRLFANEPVHQTSQARPIGVEDVSEGRRNPVQARHGNLPPRPPPSPPIFVGRSSTGVEVSSARSSRAQRRRSRERYYSPLPRTGEPYIIIGDNVPERSRRRSRSRSRERAGLDARGKLVYTVGDDRARREYRHEPFVPLPPRVTTNATAASTASASRAGWVRDENRREAVVRREERISPGRRRRSSHSRRQSISSLDEEIIISREQSEEVPKTSKFGEGSEDSDHFREAIKRTLKNNDTRRREAGRSAQETIGNITSDLPELVDYSNQRGRNELFAESRELIRQERIRQEGIRRTRIRQEEMRQARIRHEQIRQERLLEERRLEERVHSLERKGKQLEDEYRRQLVLAKEQRERDQQRREQLQDESQYLESLVVRESDRQPRRRAEADRFLEELREQESLTDKLSTARYSQ